jgi:UDP-GlcNAc:undecaprenyl-phosphate GlcNAc-1-phosphate transferase
MLAALAALLATALLVQLLRAPAQKIGLVDHPTRRKRHREPTPMSGGLALAGGLLVGLVLAFGTDWGTFWSLPAGALVLLLLGVVDDVRPLSALFRLLVQLAVSTALVLSTDIHLHLLGPILGPAVGPVGLGPLSAVFTVLCITFMINAINMTDGLDGLAGGLSFVIFVLLAVVAVLDEAPAWLIALPLLWAAALGGFLPFNARSPILDRAKVFLGDSGSMMLGYVLAWLAIALVTREGSGVTPVTMAWLLLIPAMDTLALFCRRILQGRSPFSPDRTHLHHILRRAGQTIPVAVHLIHLAVFATGLFGILG